MGTCHQGGEHQSAVKLAGLPTMASPWVAHWCTACAASALRPRRLRARAVAALVRARFRTAQVERHLAIVDPLLVARLAPEPLLTGAIWLDIARFAVGPRDRTGGGHHEQERPHHHADRSTRHHARRIA